MWLVSKQKDRKGKRRKNPTNIAQGKQTERQEKNKKSGRLWSEKKSYCLFNKKDEKLRWHTVIHNNQMHLPCHQQISLMQLKF